MGLFLVNSPLKLSLAHSQPLFGSSQTHLRENAGGPGAGEASIGARSESASELLRPRHVQPDPPTLHEAISVRKMASQGYDDSGKVSRSECTTEFDILKSSHRYAGWRNAFDALTFPAGSSEQMTKEPKIYRGTTNSPKSTTTAYTKNSPYVTSNTTNPVPYVDPIRRRDRKRLADETSSAYAGGRNLKSFQAQVKRRAATLGVITTLPNRMTTVFTSTRSSSPSLISRRGSRRARW